MEDRMEEERLEMPEEETGGESAAVEEELPESGQEEMIEDAEQAETAAAGGEREPVDYLEQVKELLAGYPELEGKEIPGEVADACVRGETTLAKAYGSYRSRMLQAENDRLRTQMAVMQQQQENRRRAPVIGTAHAPNPPQRGEDPFLAGFNSED